MSLEKRMANFELLRIITMMMVVAMHYFHYAGMLPQLTDRLSQDNIFALFFQSLSIVAVNVFVIISGYFMVKSRFKFRRFFRLVFQVLFYTLFIPLVLSIFGMPVIAEAEGIYGIMEYIFPFSTKHYWFITAYMILYLISPFLNAAFENIEKVKLKKIILILLFLFCGVKSFVPILFAFDSFGYDFGWFICLYLTGAYIRVYGLPLLNKKSRGLFVYLLSAMLILTVKFASQGLYMKLGLFKYFYEVPFHYNFIFVYLAAIGLFFFFMNINIKESWLAALIRGAAQTCLGVYLLHMNIDIRDNWYLWTEKLFGGLHEWGFWGMILKMAATVLFVFIACMIIDFIRSLIFARVEKSLIEQYETTKSIKESRKSDEK